MALTASEAFGKNESEAKEALANLKQFVSVGGVMLPRYLFYAVLVTTMLATFLLQNPFIPTEMYITTVIFGLVPTVILWYETYRLWRDRPR